MTQLPVNPEPEGGPLCLYPAAFYGEERQPVEQKEGGAQHSEDNSLSQLCCPWTPTPGAPEFPASLLSPHAGLASAFGPLFSAPLLPPMRDLLLVA